MRILIVGATGYDWVGSSRALRGRHDLVLASQQKSPEAVDIMDPASIRALFARIGRVDAVVNAAGRVAFSRSASSRTPTSISACEAS